MIRFRRAHPQSPCPCCIFSRHFHKMWGHLDLFSISFLALATRVIIYSLVDFLIRCWIPVPLGGTSSGLLPPWTLARFHVPSFTPLAGPCWLLPSGAAVCKLSGSKLGQPERPLLRFLFLRDPVFRCREIRYLENHRYMCSVYFVAVSCVGRTAHLALLLHLSWKWKSPV